VEGDVGTYLGVLGILLLGPSPEARAAAEPANVAAAARVTAIRFTGVTKLPEQRLLSLLRTRTGAPFDVETFEQDLERVETFLHENGFPLAYIEAGAGIDSEGVVTIPIQEGRIEKVTITGTKRTRRGVILRELGVRAGDVYDARGLADDRQRLYRLGFFNSVAIEPKPGSEPGKAILNIDVKERYTGSISAVMGYASNAGMVGYVQWSDTNFLGTGQTLYVNWQRGTYSTVAYLTEHDLASRLLARTGYDIGYYTPWLLSRRLAAGLRYFNTGAYQFSFFSEDIDTENIKSYEWRRGTWATLVGELGRDTSFGVLLRQENVDYNTAPVDLFAEAGALTTPARVSSVRLNLSRGPSHPFTLLDAVPRDGLFIELGHSRAAGASGAFQKFGLTKTQYVKLTPKNTLAARVQLGWSAGNLPFAELYSLGGPNTLRSYSYSRFLGTRMLALTTEWRHQLTSAVQATAFLDLGNAWGGDQRFETGGLRSAIGLGFRLATPFGPLRLDYAFGGDGGRFHVTTGSNF